MYLEELLYWCSLVFTKLLFFQFSVNFVLLCPDLWQMSLLWEGFRELELHLDKDCSDWAKCLFPIRLHLEILYLYFFL